MLPRETHREMCRRRATTFFVRAVWRYLDGSEDWMVESHLKMAAVHAEEYTMTWSCLCADCRSERALDDLDRRGYALKWSTNQGN